MHDMYRHKCMWRSENSVESIFRWPFKWLLRMKLRSKLYCMHPGHLASP